MASILFCAGPFTGHVEPMLPIAKELVRLGHNVQFLTGRAFQAKVASSGAAWLPLPNSVDFDETDLDAQFPSRSSVKGARRAQYDLEHIFIRPIAEQSAAIDSIIEEKSVDIVVVETMFFGAIPLVLRPTAIRPRVVALGSNPLSLPGRGRPPAGLGWSPARTWLGRVRNSAVNAVARRLVLRSVQRAAEQCVQSMGSELTISFLDWLTLVDAIVQLTVADFEYPLSDRHRESVHFVGPLAVSDAERHSRPSWWDDLDTSKPTVLVTQGSAELDLSQLVQPTVTAFADSDVNVLVVRGRGAIGLDERLPGNVYVTSELAYDDVFPLLSCFVTNGGYGGVGFALRHGVPVIAAGRSQDKADVVARVRWSGIGVGINRQTVTPSQIRTAFAQIRDNSRFASRADELQRQVSAASGLPGAVNRILRGA